MGTRQSYKEYYYFLLRIHIRIIELVKYNLNLKFCKLGNLHDKLYYENSKFKLWVTAVFQLKRNTYTHNVLMNSSTN